MSPESLEFVLIKSLLTSSVSDSNHAFLLLFKREVWEGLQETLSPSAHGATLSPSRSLTDGPKHCVAVETGEDS